VWRRRYRVGRPSATPSAARWRGHRGGRYRTGALDVHDGRAHEQRRGHTSPSSSPASPSSSGRSGQRHALHVEHAGRRRGE